MIGLGIPNTEHPPRIRLRILFRMLRYVRPYRMLVSVAVVTVVLYTIFTILSPQLLRSALDFGISGTGTWPHWAPTFGLDLTPGKPHPELLLWLGLAFIVTTALSGVLSFVQSYCFEYMAQRVIYDIRNAIYAHLHVLSFSFYDKAQTGQLMSRALQDVEALRRFLSLSLSAIVRASLLIFGIAPILILMSWHLALLTLATLPLLFLVVAINARHLHRAFMGQQQATGEVTERLQENFSGFRLVKVFGREQYEIGKFEPGNTRLYNEAVGAWRIWSRMSPLMTFLPSVGTVLILYFGGMQAIHGTMTVGTYGAFFSYHMMVVQPWRWLGFVVSRAALASAASERIFELLDTEPAVHDAPNACALPAVEGAVRFAGVTFAYHPGGDPALHDISFDIAPGQTIALLGPTGSGKTTIVNLIPRFYDPSDGRILIDGVDIKTVTLASLRSQIGMVMQDPFLFSDTLRANIAFGRPQATMEEVIAAAEAAQIHDFVETLPDGYDTVVGERGMTLSGGQRQRIAIARALLVDPRILLLDDSMSSVDVETESRIQAALDRLLEGRTAFVIAHRISTLRRADQIFVVDDGRIIERGTHDELLARGGLYHEIYELQLRPPDAVPAAPVSA